MAEDPLKFRRDTPPETPEDHANIWLAVERINAAWPIVGPLVAVRRNKSVIVAIVVALGWANWERIAQIAMVFAGGAP